MLVARILGCVLLVGGLTLAQELRSRSAPAFEVATVKVNATGPGPAFGPALAGGRVLARNVSARDVIRAAYALEDSQLEGIPAALRNTRFDIEARTGSAVTVDAARAMTRGLLADRFRLVAHTETRQLPIYELVIARNDRALGRRLRRSGDECSAVTLPAGIPPAPPPPPGLGTPIGAGGFHCPSGVLPGHLSLRRIDMPGFAALLWRRQLQRPVLDRTALSGRFDLDLTYLPELENINGRPASESPSLPAEIAGAPSIFTAVQEQLGLRLESTKRGVDVLIVDRLEPPTEN
jgi:uncharacterized protein (TIGR03435 family)